MEWSSKVKASRNHFKCAYCNKKRSGAYRIVDGLRSCERCNRAYDFVQKPMGVKCPLCKGGGYLTGMVEIK